MVPAEATLLLRCTHRPVWTRAVGEEGSLLVLAPRVRLAVGLHVPSMDLDGLHGLLRQAITNGHPHPSVNGDAAAQVGRRTADEAAD